MTGEARVDEARGGVGQQPQSPQRGLALQAAGQVIGDRELLEGRAEHELAWVQDEGLLAFHLHEGGELFLRQLRVDVGVAGVIEHPEQAIQPHIYGGGLHHQGVKRLDAELAGGDF